MGNRERVRYAILALITTGLTYALIVFGGIVRITGSGMGCGNDWPRCNGSFIPPINDITTLIEWSHRLAAALIGFLILGVGLYALKHRSTPELRDRGILAWALVSVGLVLVVVLFGRATVQLELPPGTVVVHLALASTLLATLLVSALLALSESPGGAPMADSRLSYPRWAIASATLGFLVLLLGGLTATTGAAPLCTGFPLCNGQLVPEGGWLVHLHSTHRLMAFALVAVIAFSAVLTVRQGAPARVRRWALAALGLVIAQIGVAAAMVLASLPSGLRALHLAVAVALWAALVGWTFLARALPTERAAVARVSAAPTPAISA